MAETITIEPGKAYEAERLTDTCDKLGASLAERGATVARRSASEAPHTDTPTATVDVLRDAYGRGLKHGNDNPSAREGALSNKFGEGTAPDPSGWTRAYWSGVRGDPFPFEDLAMTQPATTEALPDQPAVAHTGQGSLF